LYRHGISKRIYRRVGPTETDRGELYPCCTAGVSQLAHFGQGIGVYYLQLLMLSVIFVIGGLVLIPGYMLYTSSDYGDNSIDPRLYASGSCLASFAVNATAGCEDRASICEAQFREACELSKNAVSHLLFIISLTVILITIETYVDCIGSWHGDSDTYIGVSG
jgi:hypothetical protein